MGRMSSLLSLVIVICLVLVSCSVMAQAKTTVSPSTVPTSTNTQEVTSSPLPSPKPTEIPTIPPTPQPTPTPTPIPTATPQPDPWASFFTTGGAWITVPDQKRGPWSYKDENLSINIQLQKLGSRDYFRAEIYTRGPLPFGGFAYNDPNGRKRALPYLIARQNDAILGITGDYVSHVGNAKGVMIRAGKVFFDKAQAPTLAVMPDGELRVYEPGKITAKKLLAMGVKDSFAFGPILVKDSKIHPSVAHHRLWLHNWRAAIGMIEKGHYIIIVNPEGINLTELAQIFIKNKCTVAYNLDGGHSSTIVFMGEQLYKQAPGEDKGEQRSLSDLLMIGVSPAVPGPNAPVYCNGLGFNDKYKPKPTDGPLK